MQWSDISFHPSDRTLRQFVGLCLLCTGLIALRRFCFQEARASDFALVMAAAGVGIAGLWKPQSIRPIYVGWMIVVFPVGWLVSRLLLAGVFYLLLTPIGLLFRLCGRDPLTIRFPTNETTYWTAKPAPRGPRSYFRQF